MTVMGLGAFPSHDPLSLDMLGMHGSVYANYAVEQADLLIALGVRFDDRVTGKVEEFCKHGKIVHVDIDASELNKNKPAHIPVCSDVKYALTELNKIVEPPDDISGWVAQCRKWKEDEPFHYNEDFPGILQQHAIRELWKLTHDRDPVITVGVGQHQMWAAQFYKFDQPADVPLQQRPGHDGLRPARRDGRAEPVSRPARDRHRRRRQLPDEHPGAGHLLLRKAARESAAAQQPAPGHGRAVGRPLHARQPGPHVPRPDRPPRSPRPRATASARAIAIPTSWQSPKATAAAPPTSARRPTWCRPSKK